MSTELVVSIVLAAFQFLLLMVVGLVSFIFNMSLKHMEKSIDEIKLDRRSEKTSQEHREEEYQKQIDNIKETTPTKVEMREAIEANKDFILATRPG
jgi:choline-glycine betaine transporter